MQMICSYIIISFDLDETQDAFSNVEHCIKDFKTWMATKFLHLNIAQHTSVNHLCQNYCSKGPRIRTKNLAMWVYHLQHQLEILGQCLTIHYQCMTILHKCVKCKVSSMPDWSYQTIPWFMTSCLVLHQFALALLSEIGPSWHWHITECMNNNNAHSINHCQMSTMGQLVIITSVPSLGIHCSA